MIWSGLMKQKIQLPKVGTRVFTPDWDKKWDIEDIKMIMKHQGLVFEVENSARGKAMIEPLKHLLKEIDMQIKS